MQTVTTIGLNIAKSALQVHAIHAEANEVVRRQLKRRCAVTFFQKLPPYLVGIEPERRRIIARENSRR
jgi:transposase